MRTCLVVDDTNAVRKVARRILEDLGFAVLETGNAIDAISVFRNRIPDVILLDYNMPEMDGIEFLQLLRKEIDGHIPKVILCTIKRDKQQLALAMQAGADANLLKPFDAGTLTYALSEVGVI